VTGAHRTGAARLPGIGASLRWLRLLLQAVERVIEFRAQTPTARLTAAKLYDALSTALSEALEDPAAAASLRAVDECRRVARKVPLYPTGAEAGDRR
jgi:hypothetical protein